MARLLTLLPDLRHRPEGEVLLVVVDQPGGTLRYVVEAEGEGDEEDEGGQTEPVPGEAPAHEVADDDAEGRHHLGEWAADVPHVGPGGLVNVHRGDGDLQPRPQAQQQPPHVELPGLRGRHQQSPPYEQAHHGEGQQWSFPSYGVHQEDTA